VPVFNPFAKHKKTVMSGGDITALCVQALVWEDGRACDLRAFLKGGGEVGPILSAAASKGGEDAAA